MSSGQVLYLWASVLLSVKGVQHKSSWKHLHLQGFLKAWVRTLGLGRGCGKPKVAAGVTSPGDWIQRPCQLRAPAREGPVGLS